MSLKVLHLPSNIADQTETLVRGLRQFGWQADTLIYRSNPFAYSGSSPGILDRKKFLPRDLVILTNFLKRFARYDIFHFHFGKTFFSQSYELPLLKTLGKKMLMHYWGSDIRFYQQAVLNSPALGSEIIWKEKSETKKKRRARRISCIVKTALVADLELKSYAMQFFSNVMLFPQIIDVAEYRPVYPVPEKERPLILHVPSYAPLKGTGYVLKTVERLKEAYNFDFCLLGKVPHRKVKEKLAEADIVIDQLLLGTFGIFALEAMASGKPVLGYINERYRSGYPESLPIVSVTPESLERELRTLLADGKLRQRLGQVGRAYVETYHSPKALIPKLIEIYQTL